MIAVRSALSGSALALALVAILPAPSTAQDAIEKLYQKVLPSCVLIVTEKKEGGKVAMGRGTGSLIDLGRKLVVTNHHVLPFGDDARVFFPEYKDDKLITDLGHYLNSFKDGKGIPAKAVARSPFRDLAILQLESVPEGAKPLPIARTSAQLREPVHWVGNPDDVPKTWVWITRGIVTSMTKDKFRVPGADFVVDTIFVHTDVAGRPGESGGPLVNNRGELVGVRQGSTIVNGQRRGMAVELTEFRAFFQSKEVAKIPAMKTDTDTKTADSKTTDTKTPAKTDEDAQKAELAAASKLKLAKVLADDGNLSRALQYLNELIEKYPNTKAAEEAAQLQKKWKS
jgi:S1-C subfamily serine protease